jgi:antagonist of KipI
MEIEVVNPGVSTTIQDLGRVNGLAYGVPYGGAMDRTSAVLVNKILGNPISNPVLECTLIGGSYMFRGDGEICISGAEFLVRLNDVSIPQNTKVKVKNGDVLTIKSGITGRYVYIAIKGRLVAEEYWGSYSTYAFANSGGFQGRALKKGDVLKVKEGSTLTSVLKSEISIIENPVIRWSKGPEFEDFKPLDLKLMDEQQLNVSKDSNRMGYRIDGLQLTGTKTGNIISSGTFKGVIQVPNSGIPIILMSDSPSTGGYPRVGVVLAEDLDQLAQVKPGGEFKFQYVEL